jgi:hypothetical protein
MKFSIDSNVVLGIVNPEDRLHPKSISLMNSRQMDDLYICSAALKECQRVFKMKIDQIIVEIIPRLFPLYENKKMSQMERQKYLLKAFTELKSNKPRLANFIDLFEKKVDNFIKDNGVDGIPNFLSEIGLKCSQSIYKKMETIHPTEISIIHANPRHLKNIRENIAGTYFKDTNDERIFLELITNLPMIEPVVFYTDDREFVKKIDQCCTDCIKYFGYNNGSFSCNLLDET